MRSYAITFRPKAEMLKKANEPLYILRELRKLGELELVAETDRLPRLAEIEAGPPLYLVDRHAADDGDARADRRSLRIRGRRLRA